MQCSVDAYPRFCSCQLNLRLRADGKGAQVLKTIEKPVTNAQWGRPARNSAHQVIWNAVAVPSFQIAVAGVDVAAATTAPTATQVPTRVKATSLRWVVIVWIVVISVVVMISVTHDRVPALQLEKLEPQEVLASGPEILQLSNPLKLTEPGNPGNCQKLEQQVSSKFRHLPRGSDLQDSLFNLSAANPGSYDQLCLNL